MFLSLLAPISLVILSTRGAAAQTQNASTDVVCEAQFDWMNNGVGQNPCLVSSYLRIPCQGANTLLSVKEDGAYVGSTGGHTNTCYCNTVFYSTLAACAYCQGVLDPNAIQTWSAFISRCAVSDLSIGRYPTVTPQGTQIPDWAFIFNGSSDYMNVTQIKLFAEGVTSTALTSTTSTTSSSSTSSSSVSASTTPSAGPNADTTASSNHSSSNTGAIVGGVVGGVAVLAIAAVGVYFFYYRPNRRPPSRLFTRPTRGTQDVGGHINPFMTEREQAVFSPTSTRPAMTIYNPDDPSTFPPATEYQESSAGAPSSFSDANGQRYPLRSEIMT